MTQFNDGKHIVGIMGRQACHTHNAPLGVPCYHLRKNKGSGYYAGICNKRAVMAGANGKISDSSYSSKPRMQRARQARAA